MCKLLQPNTDVENIYVVTSNQLITAENFSGLSLVAKKLCYFAFAQCQLHDKTFFRYQIDVEKLAKLIGITLKNFQRKFKSISAELDSRFITVRTGKEHSTQNFKLFEIFKFENHSCIFELHSDMSRFLLNLKRNFSKPILAPFLKFKSVYSIEIWHLMQQKMLSRYPGMTGTMKFTLTVEELRLATVSPDENNDNDKPKHNKMSHFKENVLDRAIREICKNEGLKITYIPGKATRPFVDFTFYVTYFRGPYQPSPALLAYIEKRLKRLELNSKKLKRTITCEEECELEKLIFELEEKRIPIFPDWI